jgi:hypothetical protein
VYDHHRPRFEPELAKVRSQAPAGAGLRRPVYEILLFNPGDFLLPLYLSSAGCDGLQNSTVQLPQNGV